MWNSLYGIALSLSEHNTIADNIADWNGQMGIYTWKAPSNSIIDNTASNNWIGIYVSASSKHNIIMDNYVANNSGFGIDLVLYADNNTVVGNYIISNNEGILIQYSINNTVYNNNFINNTIQAFVRSASNNVFNLPAPTGGNYWSDWTTPDLDSDGFVDFPYVFTTGQDNLPWARESGWADNTPPEITITTPQSYGLYTVGMTLDFSATDDESGVDTIIGQLTNTAGEYQEVDSGFQPQPGVYTLVVTATDVAGNTGESDPVFFVVYDSEGGFVTGGGWILLDEESTLPGGKANFGFVAKYKKDTSTGNLEFQYHDAGINLKSTTVDWLVISTVTAHFQGTGTINGEGLYTFRVTVKDNSEPGVGVDQFAIKIWEGIDTEADPYHKAKNTLSGGNIVVHKK
jgi:parallel beta-helix repeat protein